MKNNVRMQTPIACMVCTLKNMALISYTYYGIVKDEQCNYHLGKMYGYVCVCVCVCVISKFSLRTKLDTNPGDHIRNHKKEFLKDPKTTSERPSKTKENIFFDFLFSYFFIFFFRFLKNKSFGSVQIQ
jgi:hypothetical protein